MDYVAICDAIRKEKRKKIGLNCAKKKFGGCSVAITHRAAVVMCRCLDSVAVYAVEVYLSNRTNVRRVLPHEYTCRYPYSGTLLGQDTTSGLATPTTKTYCSFCDCQIFRIGITKVW